MHMPDDPNLKMWLELGISQFQLEVLTNYCQKLVRIDLVVIKNKYAS